MKKNNLYYILSLILAAIYVSLDLIIENIPIIVELLFLIAIIILFVLIIIYEKKNKRGKKNEWIQK